MRDAAGAAVIKDADEALDLRGQHLGPSEWLESPKRTLTRSAGQFRTGTGPTRPRWRGPRSVRGRHRPRPHDAKHNPAPTRVATFVRSRRVHVLRLQPRPIPGGMGIVTR